MNPQMSTYDHWGIVIVNSAIFIIFAFSFYHPRSCASLCLHRGMNPGVTEAYRA